MALYDDETRGSVQAVGAGAGSALKPIAYVPLDEARAAAATNGGTLNDDRFVPLTIPEAKARLARTLGVDPAAIRITVEE